MLKMKKACEQCQDKLAHNSLAFICSFECTFCEACAEGMNHVCPNCAGELLPRPKRTRSPIEVAASQVKAKLFQQQ